VCAYVEVVFSTTTEGAWSMLEGEKLLIKIGFTKNAF
jgi:hypothetical protein